MARHIAQGGTMTTNANAAIAALATATSKETIGAEIITKTLDALNKPGKKDKSGLQGAMAASYECNKSILSSVYNPTGGIADLES